MNEDRLARDLLQEAMEAARLDPRGHVFYRPATTVTDDLEEAHEDDVIVAPGQRVFQNRYVDALLLQHSQLRSYQHREYLERLLLNHASSNPIACATVIRLDRFPDAAKREAWLSVGCLTVVRDTLRYEPDLLAERLDSVKRLASDLINRLRTTTQPRTYPEYRRLCPLPQEDLARQLLKLAAEVPFARHLRRLHESENPEINTDQWHVEASVRLLGLDPELVSLLAHIEQQFHSGGNDFQFASCLGRLRAFYEALLAELVPVVEDLCNERFRGNLANEKNCRSYLKSVGILAASETDLLDSVYGFLSAEGAHALSAGREQARIAKNILIELVWLLMQRVNKLRASALGS